MSWSNKGNKQEARVSNPFALASTGSAPMSAFGGQQQRSPFGSFGNKTVSSSQPFSQSAQAPLFSTPSRFGSSFSNQQRSGKGKGKVHDTQIASEMQDEALNSNATRVSNPFEAIGAVQAQALSLTDAVAQYKSEYIRRRGYPFSCFGLPEEAPVLQGEISPAELRWYLSQGDSGVQQKIVERSSLLNEDFTEFLRGACGDEPVQLKRAGPYRVPDAQFPTFVPRQPFPLIADRKESVLSENDLYIFQSRNLPEGGRVPSNPPPLELR
jgi:hypothetical protein